MGWVKKRFAIEQLYRTGVDALWDQFRDAVGQAVMEFNDVMTGTMNSAEHSDCTSNGKHCIRVKRTAGSVESSVEVYLVSKTRKILTNPSATGLYGCEDLSHLEFCFVGNPLTAEQACERALWDFLFTSPKILKSN